MGKFLAAIQSILALSGVSLAATLIGSDGEPLQSIRNFDGMKAVGVLATAVVTLISLIAAVIGIVQRNELKRETQDKKEKVSDAHGDLSTKTGQATQAALAAGTQAVVQGDQTRANNDANTAKIMATLEKMAAQQVIKLDASSEETIAQSIGNLLASTDARKAPAREAVEAGNIDEPASRLMGLGEQEAAAADDMGRAAAESFKEAGALRFAYDSRGAIEAYEKALKYTPDDPETLNQLGSLYLHLRIGEMDRAKAVRTKLLEIAGSDQKLIAVASRNLGNVEHTRQSRRRWRLLQQSPRID